MKHIEERWHLPIFLFRNRHQVPIRFLSDSIMEAAYFFPPDHEAWQDRDFCLGKLPPERAQVDLL